MKTRACSLLLLAAAATIVAGCGATAPETKEEAQSRSNEVQATIAKFKETDPGLKKWFDESHGYAIFPTVGKGGVGVGGAYGEGEVYEKGELTGYSSLSQATIGFQLGGQAYSEVIFFKDKPALDRFRSGQFELSAQASAVAATAGASADADYSGGVAIFTMAQGGLMYEAAVGGQKFDYVSK
ncbi:MAG: lipid-binding SYLF domain-containing protein [Planctomycetota bacterium]|jgi:lipid-binding SYLF domain-containing protein